MEIGAEAVAKHRDRNLISYPAKLQDMVARKELRFVDQHAVQRALLQLLGDLGKQVDIRIEGIGRGIDSDARADGAWPKPSLLQEAIDHASLHNRERLLGLLLGVIAKHVREHLGVEDAARR